jgi:hypothetical protein
MGSFFDRDRQIAGPGFSRWLVPPAALAIHLCIGQAYAFSVFNLPLTKVFGVTSSAPDIFYRHRIPGHFSRPVRPLG